MIFRRIRKNNKGNTLAIVMVGIFVLSILGTMILGATANNLYMKASDKKTEKALYNVEKASDELYASIGADVMNIAKASYNDILENYVEKEVLPGQVKPTYKQISSAEATNLFHQYMTDGKRTDINTFEIRGLKSIYPSTENLTDDEKQVIIQGIFDRFMDSTNPYFAQVNGYSISVSSSDDEPTEVLYEEDANGFLEKIILKNVCLTCEANNGYYASIISDYSIRIPRFDLDFTDSSIGDNMDEFFKYSIIAQGSAAGAWSGSGGTGIQVTNSNTATVSGVNITGNVYAGSSKGRDAVNINNNSKVQINSKVFIADGEIKINDSEMVFRNINGVDAVDGPDVLQLYAGNISTENNSDSISSKIDIAGDVILEDDLEVNDLNSKVKVSGNLFGYGFRADASDPYSEADTKETVAIRNTAGTTVAEHKQSSAIIVNANGSNCDFTGIKKLVLAGRAYIDLDPYSAYTSYMTGESVSIKGNQSVYLADTELIGSMVAGMNPISYIDLKGIYSNAFITTDTDGAATYASLGLNTNDNNRVVAKMINDDVYFYERTTSPALQTSYFVDAFIKNTNGKRNNLQNRINAMATGESKINVLFSDALESYTVGAIVQVDNGNLKGNLLYGPNNIGAFQVGSKLGFYDILNDIKVRKSNIIPALNDTSDVTRIGYGKTTLGEDVNNSGTKVYDYFIDSNKLQTITEKVEYTNLEEGLVQGALSNSDEARALGEKLAAMYGYSSCEAAASTENIGVLISYKADNSKITPSFKKGIVVTNHPVEIKESFSGMIVSNETVSVYDNGTKVDIEADKDLVKLLFASIPELKEAFNFQVSVSGNEENSDVVKGESLAYTDLVKVENWRRNYR